jgi:hypothetical protein
LEDIVAPGAEYDLFTGMLDADGTQGVFGEDLGFYAFEH